VFTDHPLPDGTPAVRLDVKVVPGARRTEIAGPLGDRLKIRVAAPPEDGKANRAVCELVARELGVKERFVTVLSGQSNPEKTLLILGISAQEARSRAGFGETP
jgi:uncharacterized protein